MLYELRKRLILFIIRRNFKKTKLEGKNVSFQNARNIGLIALVDSKERMELLVNFKKTIETHGSAVHALAFVPFKIIPDYFNTQMQVEVFSKKDVNVIGIPTGKMVRHFMEKEFDMLIDLTIEDIVPLHYLAGMCKSRIKAGKFREQMLDIYDIMIREQEKMSYQEFQFSIKNYLSKINTSKA